MSITPSIEKLTMESAGKAFKELTLIRHYFEPARPANPAAVGNGAVP